MPDRPGHRPLRRRLGRSLAVLTATVMVGALVWVGHSPAGENAAALEEYREQTVRENAVAASESIVPTAAEAELGTGPKLDGPAPGQSKKISLRSGDRTREGVLSVPAGYDPEKAYPVVLTYHGYRETAQGFHDYAGFDEKPAITVSMQGIGDAWEGAPYSRTKDGEDVRFTRDMLAALNSTYNVDRSRIYAAGMSNGGGMVAKLACREPRLFAAVAAVAGAYYSGTRTNCVEDAGRAPSFLEIHGTEDETINYGGGSRHGGTYMAARDLVEDVASRNHCQSTPVTTALAGDVRRQQWPMCSPGTSVVHLRVGDGGHTWPGDASGKSGAASDSAEATSYSLDATTEVWAFLSGHHLT
ncbi:MULTISPECIES: alpha/beta hydrolase family esterase [unclassified Corynebacterium]|uniref:alpha/beta hydrolase family esterase n=1 Tax=unclassified Corynebacterium TaxID=2624378 RepID=UPI0030A18DA9